MMGREAVLAWDPDYAELSPAEARTLDVAMVDETVRLEDIDWGAPRMNNAYAGAA